jgi:excisionase family DNA binding protein
MSTTGKKLSRQGKLYSLKEAAYELSLSRATLYRRIESGDLSALKLGARTVISQSELERFKEANLKPFKTPRKGRHRGGRRATF